MFKLRQDHTRTPGSTEMLMFKLFHLKDGDVCVSLSRAGPSHMSLYLMPHRGAGLSTWSFGDGTPHFDLSGEYFIFYSHGLDVHTWTFWFEIQV